MAVTQQPDDYKWAIADWAASYNQSQNVDTNTGNINIPDTSNATWNLGNWNYWDTSIDRQEQIVRNLNDAYQQDPTKFSDWSTFSKNFNYDYSWRSDTERQTMKSWYEDKMWQQWGIDYNNSNNTDYFLSQLISWQTLQWQWAAATAAYNRYKDYQSLSWMTPEQIASAVSSDSINPVGQSMVDLKNYSPELYAQVQGILQNKTQVEDINAVWTGIYDGLTKTETNSNYTKYNFTDEYAQNASVIKQYNESLYKKIEWLGGDTAAYVSIVASMLQNPLIQANKDEIQNIEWEINKVQNSIWTIGDTARERLWSEAPEDLVSAYISQQTKELQNQLRTLNNSLLVSQWKLDNQLTEVDTLIDAINQWLKTYGEDEASKWNYQYVSWSKYQEAWYFDKDTWQFYKLGEMPDTHDYESSDPTRLQDIANNLVDIANSDDVYVFRDRSSFNDYFKYNKRSAAQKAVLDDFWNANSAALKEPAQKAWASYQKAQAAKVKTPWGWDLKDWEDWDVSNDKWQKLKNAIINWDVAWSYEKTSMKKYWFTSALNEEEVAVKMAQICTLGEYKKIYNALWETARWKFENEFAIRMWQKCKPSEYKKIYDSLWTSTKEKFLKEIKTRIQNTVKNNWSKITKRMDDAWWSIWWADREAEAEKLAKELWINFEDLWKSAIIAYYYK